jgi:hypothetical protein
MPGGGGGGGGLGGWPPPSPIVSPIGALLRKLFDFLMGH